MPCVSSNDAKNERSLRAASVLLLVVAGCATTKSGMVSDGPSSAEYAPFPLGSSWTYDVEYPGQKGEMTIELVGERDGYKIDNRKGQWQHTPKGLRDKDRYLIRHPIETGASWQSVTGPSAVEHYEIVSVGSACESLAGKFEDCLVVNGKIRQNKDISIHITWTWARDVGLVKLSTESERGGKRRRQVWQSLKAYSVGDNKSGALKSPAPTEDDGPNTWTTE